MSGEIESLVFGALLLGFPFVVLIVFWQAFTIAARDVSRSRRMAGMWREKWPDLAKHNDDVLLRPVEVAENEFLLRSTDGAVNADQLLQAAGNCK